MFLDRCGLYLIFPWNHYAKKNIFCSIKKARLSVNISKSKPRQSQIYINIVHRHHCDETRVANRISYIFFFLLRHYCYDGQEKLFRVHRNIIIIILNRYEFFLFL